MAVKRVFISFDYDHDNDLRGNLVAQTKNPDSPFSIRDRSVKYRIDENWRKEVRDRIRGSDLTIVICGEHTHDAPGVAAEVTIAREERKPYFLLKGRWSFTAKVRAIRSTRPLAWGERAQICWMPSSTMVLMKLVASTGG